VSNEKTRTLAEIPWLSLLPPEQRAGLEPSCDDPGVAQWDALAAAERTLEEELARPGSLARIVKPLAAAGVIAVMLLAVDAPSVTEQRPGGGGSSATASGTVTASIPVTSQSVAEENRITLVSRAQAEVAGDTAGGTEGRKPKPSRGGGAPATPSSPPPATDDPAASPPLASATLPIIGEVEVPAPKVEVPGVELPQLPPLQLPQLPQLPPLLQ
jgi:hypothetical protein